MDIYPLLNRLPSLKNCFSKNKISIGGTCDEFNMMMLACDFYRGISSIFVVLPNLYLAQKYYDGLLSFVKDEDVLFFPADELMSAAMVAATGDFLFERIQTIFTLLTEEKKIVVMNIHGAIKYELPKEIWLGNIFTLKKNMSIEFDDLLTRFVRLGYEKVYTITKTGEFSRRGSIVDIFPLGFDRPVRIDFFGDEIDTIRYFDMETQRSLEETNGVVVLPVTEFMFDESDFISAKKNIMGFMDQFKLSSIEQDQLNKDLFSLENHQNLDQISRYMQFFNPNISTIFDFVEQKRIYVIDPVKSREMTEQLVLDLNEYCGRIGGYSIANMKLFENIDCIISQASVTIEGLRSIRALDYTLGVKEVASYKAKEKTIIEDFKRYQDNKYIIFSYTNEERFKRLLEACLEEHVFLVKVDDVDKIEYGQINCIYGNYPAFDMMYDGVLFLNEASLFEISYAPRKAHYKSIYKNAIKISKYDELEVGDYVVHYDYGIGKYLGMKTMETSGIKRDFLYVMYNKGSSLYIPLEQISSIMKYASKDVEGVKLHEIGSTAWARTKAKVRKRVHDISGDLIKLYAARQNAKGFEFLPDTTEQLEFEADFTYELTPDQKNAIDAVKADMESPRPMDRLICGDVGYGKTEVAMRAAFKAVYSGKQVAMLAPTTILASQHYRTFKDRMEEYGIRVELLSRFVPATKQTQILEDLKKGGVDVIIGTHRLLSKEVVYKDLGLLIVDEEQRFGVSHKERIKELKVNVDCITLSATPIPRTLQMSMLGLKDLSMIETPPKNRYPVQTYVLERNDRIIADAIEREISRGGQVFYLYNFVETIEEMEAKLKKLVPMAKICVGHGKLSHDQLENRIRDFIQHKYDVLLCTTIIETGIDMPDTNTLIIHDANRLGLAQLYQIRGRVGRSNKIAYAYMMYEPRKMLTEEAEKRLETIKEFNELGSGFKIAMRDLSIRGSGDLLGEEQSGFVESVGLDMYLKILNEEIEHITAHPELTTDVSISTPFVSRTISKEYIENEDVRIEIHKKIDKLKTLKSLHELQLELEDRFGQIDEELMLYMYEKLMKNYCKRLDIYKIDTTNKRYYDFIFSEEKTNQSDGNFLFTEMLKYTNLKLTYNRGEIHILLEVQGRNKLDYFKEICNYFQDIDK
ncbi:MAG: transcription-repair coupling factor [Anaeroplasmataceae bacterium]|nr:transcription-repair coupling factor [Anaeroplasmataceae bacterium]